MQNNLKYKILIVEDDVNLGYLLEKLLQPEGYQTVRVKTGKNGILESNKNIYSLYVIDIGLPDISGFKIVEHIRSFNQDVPVIIITDKSSIENEVESFKKRATLFHKKPLNPALLCLQVNNFFFKANTNNSFNIGNLVILENDRTLNLNNQKIQLSRAEFNLLMLLLRNKIKTFSRGEIINKIFDRNKNSTDSAVDTLISRLRKKMKAIGYGEFIQTVHNIGYKITDYYLDQIRRGVY